MLTSAPHNHCRISGDQTTRRNFERTYIRRAPFRQVARSKRARVQRAAVPQPKPSDQETVEYVDTWSDVQFINMCRRAYGGLAGWQSPRSWKDGSETYEGMLEVSRALMKVKLCVQVHLSGLSFLAHQTTIRATADLPHRMSFTPHAVSSMCLNRQTYIGSHDLSYRMSRPVQTQVMLHQTGPGHNAAAKQQLALQGKTAAQQRDAVIKGFPKVPAWFRKVFPYSKWGAELNARITPAFFTWLVGPMHREETEIDGIVQKSSVHIKRCRYLAESGCVGMCVNLCKTPTQTFFTEELGMPLTMKPNFEDYSCDMVFGQRPLNLAEDEVNLQACYAECPQAKSGTAKCHKLA